MRTLGMLVVVLCVFVWSPRQTFAQEQRTGASAVLSELAEGGRVRVLVPPDTVVEGNVATASARSLVLSVNDPGTAGGAVVDRTAAVESIEALWTRGRRTWLGAGIGAGVGGVLGGLTGAIAHDLCESDCGDAAGTIIVVGIVGAGGGALLGALIGSAFSKWDRQFEQAADGRGWQHPPQGRAPVGLPTAEPGPPPTPVSGPFAGRTGWLNAHAGGSVSTGAESTQVGLLLGASIMADFGALRIGPEVLFGGIGGSQGVITYGGVVHVPLRHASLEPYLVAGAGGQGWNSTGPDYEQLDASLFALNGGVGLRLPAGSRTAVGVELRAHHSVQNYGAEVPWLFTLAATFGYGL